MPEPTWPEQQHQLAAPHLEVDVGDADRAVVVHGREAAQLQALQRLARGPAPGAGASPVHEVDAGAAASTRSAPAANRPVATCQDRVPGASVTTAPATTPNQAKPFTALATSSVGRQVPPAREEEPPRRRRRRRCSVTIGTRVEHRLHPVLEDRGPHAAGVDLAAGARARAGVRAASLTVRAESSAETSARPNRARAADDRVAERPAIGRPIADAAPRRP